MRKITTYELDKTRDEIRKVFLFASNSSEFLNKVYETAYHRHKSMIELEEFLATTNTQNLRNALMAWERKEYFNWSARQVSLLKDKFFQLGTEFNKKLLNTLLAPLSINQVIIGYGKTPRGQTPSKSTSLPLLC